MQSRETRFVLRIESGERQGEQVPLSEGTLQVGRRPECGLVLTDGSVSGKHAELRVAGERVELVDLGSTNGTRVSGQKIEQAVLGHGDALLFGNVRATLHDARLAGAPPAPPPAPGEAPSAPADSGALGKVSAEKVSRSVQRSRLPLVLIALLLLLGAGAFAYLKFLQPAGVRAERLVLPAVPGNLLADGSFEEATAEWSAAEAAPVAFLRERGFARSGEVGLGATLEDGAWSLARSPEFPLHVRRSLACALALRVDDSAAGRAGVELSSADQSLPAFFAWAPARRAGAGFEELEIAFDVPGGYDRGRLVVAGTGPGAIALDDVSVLEREALGGGAKFTEYELVVLGSPGSTAMLLRSGRPLLTGLDLSSWNREGLAGWSEAKLGATAGPRGFQLAFPGAPAEAELAFVALRPDEASAGEGGWVATTGAEGYASYGGDFTRAGVTSLLMGSGTELVRMGFEQPVEVSATGIPGAVLLRVKLGGLEGCELQLAFVEERTEAATLADRATEAERARDLGAALASWSELLDRFPYERKLVTQAAETRARLVQTGLGEVDELRREMERARFFLLPELFQNGETRALELARRYQGSEVEAEARAVARQCAMARSELTAGRRTGAVQHLQGVLESLDPAAAPRLTEHVRKALEGLDAGPLDPGGPVDPGSKED